MDDFSFVIFYFILGGCCGFIIIKITWSLNTCFISSWGAGRLIVWVIDFRYIFVR